MHYVTLQSCGDLGNVVKLKNKKLSKFKLPLQPFFFVVGRSLCDVDGAYVVIDEVTYRLESVFKAVDICFKSFQALHAAYPAESYSVLLFLQHAEYDIETDWDRPAINVNTLKSSLQIYNVNVIFCTSNSSVLFKECGRNSALLNFISRLIKELLFFFCGGFSKQVFRSAF